MRTIEEIIEHIKDIEKRYLVSIDIGDFNHARKLELVYGKLMDEGDALESTSSKICMDDEFYENPPKEFIRGG